MLDGTGRRDVLQIHPGAAAGFRNETQEGVKVPLPERLGLPLHPLVLLIEMNGSEDRSVRYPVPQFRQRSKEIRLRDVPQNFFPKECADPFHLTRDGGVFLRQIRMVSAAVDDAQGVTRSGKVMVDPLHHRAVRVMKIDEHHAAHTGCRLIHQAAGFSEIHIFRILTHLGNLHSRELLIKEQLIANRSNQHFKSRRGTETAAREYAGTHTGIKALQLRPLLGKCRRHAPNQGCSGIFLRFMHRQVIQGYLNNRVSL